MKWIKEEEDHFDVLGAKDLSISGKDACQIAEGDVGELKFGKGWYAVRILAKGEFVRGFQPYNTTKVSPTV